MPDITRDLTDKEFGALHDAIKAYPDTWRPSRGYLTAAKALAAGGLLLDAGVTTQWPHILFVASVKGRERYPVELAKAEHAADMADQ